MKIYGLIVCNNTHNGILAYFCSVRVSNELGAGNPKVAKFSVFVVTSTSILISVVFTVIIVIFQVGLSKLFTSDPEVIEAVIELIPLLAISVFLNGIQPILSGTFMIELSTILKFPDSEISGVTFMSQCFQVWQLEVVGKTLWLMLTLFVSISLDSQ